MGSDLGGGCCSGHAERVSERQQAALVRAALRRRPCQRCRHTDAAAADATHSSQRRRRHAGGQPRLPHTVVGQGMAPEGLGCMPLPLKMVVVLVLQGPQPACRLP